MVTSQEMLSGIAKSIAALKEMHVIPAFVEMTRDQYNQLRSELPYTTEPNQPHKLMGLQIRIKEE